MAFHIAIILIKSVFHYDESNYYYNISLEKHSYSDKIYFSKGSEINKTSASKECGICHYWYFLDKDWNRMFVKGFMMY